MLRKLIWSMTLLAGTWYSGAQAQDRWPSRTPPPYPERRDEWPQRGRDRDDDWYRRRDDWRRDSGYNRPSSGYRRSVWQYAAYNGGRFQDRGAGVWIQYRRGQAEIPFEEVRRTAEYVELVDRARQLPVRIYADKLYQNEGGRGWTLVMDGYWE